MQKTTTLPDQSAKLIPLMYLSIFFIAAIIAADILTHKIIYVFGYTASAAIIFFPLTYTISDITVEAYGRKIAIRMLIIAILAEFYVDTLLSLIGTTQVNNTNAEDLAFKQLLEPLQLIFWGNLIALAASALMNVLVMNKLKQRFQGRYFISRTLVATFSSEIFYIIIAYSIWFWGVLPLHVILTMMTVSMAFKVVFALTVAYPAKYITKKIIGVEQQTA